MGRAFLIVLDSVGIGGAPDAAAYGDTGADTVGHIAEACARGEADCEGLRSGPLRLPNLAGLGLGEACRLATGRFPPGLQVAGPVSASYAAVAETSPGKDTPSGHWEMAGAPAQSAWHYFPHKRPAFPPRLIKDLCAMATLNGILGDCHASGTAIIAEYGVEHIRTDKPICYTSADSVFQIAAHEAHFGLSRLYEVCAIARRLLDPYQVGRVIARPFVGDAEHGFSRTANRRDMIMEPPMGTLLDRACAGGRSVISIGKIADIFAGRSVGSVVKAADNDAGMSRILEAVSKLSDGGLLFANLNDFDTIYGHRRDVAGYAAALERFDLWLPNFLTGLRAGDLAIITADHGCDPTWPGNDHTREQVPLLIAGPACSKGETGRLSGFEAISNIAATHLGLL